MVKNNNNNNKEISLKNILLPANWINDENKITMPYIHIKFHELDGRYEECFLNFVTEFASTIYKIKNKSFFLFLRIFNIAKSKNNIYYYLSIKIKLENILNLKIK